MVMVASLEGVFNRATIADNSLLLISFLTFLITHTTFGYPDGANIRQLMQIQQNQQLISDLGTQYEIVYPIQHREDWIRGLSTREILPENKVSHLHKTYILIETLEQKFHLDLELNVNLLAPTLVQAEYNPSLQIIEQDIENCFYHATVRNHTGAYAALRTCYGLSGVIYFEKGVYLIHPLYGDDDSMNHPHLLYHYYGDLDEKFKCANEDDDQTFHCMWEKLQHFTEKAELMGSKYIEMALFMDKNFFELYESYGKDPVSEAVQIINCADLLYRTMNTSLSVVYLEVWRNNQINMSNKITVTLENLLGYVSDKLTRMSVDAAQLLSGFNFNNGETSVAVTDSICTVNALGITKVSNIVKPHISSLSVVHILGHNLGMYHDSECCKCSSSEGCVLSNSLRSLNSFSFSSCSIEDYYKTLGKGYGECLFNMPRMRESICGNGIVEKEEECDCGSPEACLKHGSCCDPMTCRYIKHAECSVGSCCRKCKLLSTDSMCRPSKGECDVPEFCDGMHGECPPDLHKRNGIVCSGGLGYCYNGYCPTVQKQCEAIWGYGSDSAHSICYDRLNAQGTPYGNCGSDEVGGRLVKCSKQNAVCGMLQCRHGRKSPVMSQKPLEFIVNKITLDGESHECKVVPISASLEIYASGLVLDGTKCGFQKFCLNKTCIRIRSVASGSCIVTGRDSEVCSGHGVCTNINTCFCDEGWIGEQCSMREEPLDSTDDMNESLKYLFSGGNSTIDGHEQGTLRKDYRNILLITIIVTSLLIGFAVVASILFIFVRR